MNKISPELIKELSCLDSFYFVRDLKVSDIKIDSMKSFIKLLCAQSKPIKEDANIIKMNTEWTYVNQLLQIKVFDKNLIQKIMKKKELADLTKSSLYFDYVLLKELGQIGMYYKKSKNNYPIFWARDFYYKITSDNFELSLR